MVKRTVKYSLGLLAVVMIALVIAPFFLDVNNYRSQIENAVEDATGRKLQIGEIEASLFPWVGVRLENVTLANRSGFSQREFLKVESLDVQVALLPLLSKEIEIKQFSLDAPELFLEKNAAGEGNWEDLLSSTNTTDASATGEGKEQKSKPNALAALNAESLSLNHGRFIWVDAVTGGKVELADLKVEFNDVQTERPIEVAASARLGSDTIRLTARLGPLGDLAALDVEKLPLQVNLKSDLLHLRPLAAWLPELPGFLGKKEDAALQLNLQVEQRPDGLRLSIGDAVLIAAVNAQANWKIEMPSQGKIQLQEFAVGLRNQPLMSAQGELYLGKSPHYQLTIKSNTIKRTWLAALLPDLKTMYAGHPSPWQEIKFGALVSGDAERLDLRDLQFMLDQEAIQASGVASIGGSPDVRLRLTARELHADPWLPEPAKKKAAPASVQTELASRSVESQEPDLRFLKSWRISSEMQVEKMHLRGLRLTHLRATFNGSRGLFKLSPLRFDLAGGQVSETASLNVAVYPARWTESVHMSGVRVGPVLKSLAGVDMLEGVLQMDTNLKGKGLLPETGVKKLNGRGSVLLRNGSVKGFDIAGTLRSLTSPGKGGGPKKTDFSQLQASFNIKSGIVKNDDLFMASPLFRLTGNGVVNLPQGSLDYHVKPKLVGTLAGQGDTVTVRKGLSVPLRIRGPFASLRITPEVDPATLIENIGVIQKGGLGNILGGQPAQKSGKAKQKQQKKMTPEQQIKKKLEGLMGF